MNRKYVTNYAILFPLREFGRIYFFFARPFSADPKALENTKPFSKAYTLMAFFSLTCSAPLIKYLSLNGVMLGILGVNIIFVIFISQLYFADKLEGE